MPIGVACTTPWALPDCLRECLDRLDVAIREVLREAFRQRHGAIEVSHRKAMSSLCAEPQHRVTGGGARAAGADLGDPFDAAHRRSSRRKLSAKPQASVL